MHIHTHVSTCNSYWWHIHTTSCTYIHICINTYTMHIHAYMYHIYIRRTLSQYVIVQRHGNLLIHTNMHTYSHKYMCTHMHTRTLFTVCYGEEAWKRDVSEHLKVRNHLYMYVYVCMYIYIIYLCIGMETRRFGAPQGPKSCAYVFICMYLYIHT